MQEHQSSGPFIGVDVAKDELVVCTHGQSSLTSIPNQAASIARWLKTLEPGSYIAMESTGRYHALLATLAWQAGLSVYVLNARDVSFYAKALGGRAKTDGVDAKLLARYLAEHRERLHPWSGAHPQLEHLQTLLSRRTRLAVERSAAAQVLGEGLSALPEAKALLAAFDTLLQRLEHEITRLIEADPERARRYECLQSIPGIGPATAGMLAALFSRIDFANADAVVAYSGLDPRARDSGTKRGRRRLSKRGPGQLRRNVYLAGFAASRSNALKGHYQALRARGLSTTESFVILGRKLLRVAFSLWRTGKRFDPTLIGRPAV